MKSSKARATRRLEVTLDELRALRRRIDHAEIQSSDRALLGALVSQQIGLAERRDARMLAKIAATVAASSSTSEPSSEPKEPDASAGAPASSSPSVDAKATSNDEASTPAAESDATGEKPEPGDDSKRKGHGRNGASAFRAAQHDFYALALGVVGAVCTACRIGTMYRYREKIILRIVGQPMFRAEQHHHEQARCRNCGRVVRADGPACVHEGVGTEYIRYDGSACAMLLFMHYTGGAPFKRLESHHAGWGVPMPDANQWEVVDKADDLLLPLYRALEQHAIERATNFRIDDTGSVVITLKRQIEAELAALRAEGKSTKGVRTGINATGIYWETLDGPVVLYYTGRHHAGEIIDQVLGRRLAGNARGVDGGKARGPRDTRFTKRAPGTGPAKRAHELGASRTASEASFGSILRWPVDRRWEPRAGNPLAGLCPRGGPKEPSPRTSDCNPCFGEDVSVGAIAP